MPRRNCHLQLSSVSSGDRIMALSCAPRHWGRGSTMQVKLCACASMEEPGHQCFECPRWSVKETTVSSWEWPSASVCRVALCSLTIAAWASATALPRPEHSQAFICGCTRFSKFLLFCSESQWKSLCKFTLAIFVKSASWQWLWLKAKQVEAVSESGDIILAKMAFWAQKRSWGLLSGAARWDLPNTLVMANEEGKDYGKSPVLNAVLLEMHVQTTQKLKSGERSKL